MRKTLLNLFLFQAGWLVCILGGNYYALAFTFLAMLLHAAFVVSKSSEWILIAIVAATGICVDLLFSATGILFFPGAGFPGLPIWLLCLWMLFATTIEHGLAWLQKKLWLASAAAAVFGPASYWAGSRLTDAQLGEPVVASILIIALAWGVLLPIALNQAGNRSHA